MYGLLIVLVITGAAAVLYRIPGFRGRVPYAALSPRWERLLAVLPLAGYAAGAAADLLAGSGSLAFNPVLPAAALFYMILIFATGRLVFSLALSAAIVVLANLPSPLL